MIDPKHHIAIHLDKAPVTVAGKARVIRPRSKTCRGCIGQIEDGVIVPGIEARAPDLTDTNSGLAASANRQPVILYPRKGASHLILRSAG